MLQSRNLAQTKMTTRDIFLAIMVITIWGSYFTASKLSLNSFPPFLTGGLRFLTLFIITFPFYFKDKPPLKNIFLLSLTYTGSLSALYIAINKSINLAPIILIYQFNIPITIFLGIIFLRERFSFVGSLGLLIAFTGLILITKTSNDFFLDNNAIYLVFLAAFLFSCYNFIAKSLSASNPLTILSRVSLFIFPQLLLLSFLQENWPLLKEIQLQPSLALLYIVIICSLLANYSWLYLLRKYPLSKLMPFTLLTPVFGCIITSITLSEKIENIHLLGGAIVMLGLFIIEFNRLDNSKQTKTSQIKK